MAQAASPRPGPGAIPGTAPDIKRANAAAVIGTMLEYYDFILYGLAASLVFAPLFFPGSDPFVGTLQSLGTFAVGFLLRPIGGVFFGRLGDRVGRKRVLIITMLLMGGATTAIGLLPTYAQVGALAPALLIVARMIQGLGASAEFGGATIVAIEFAPKGKRALFGSLPGAGMWAGSILATAVLTVMALLPDDQFLSWGWRLPFLLSIVLVGYGLWLRSGLPETPVYAELQEEQATKKSPIRSVLSGQRRAVLCVAAAAYGTASIGFFYQVFALNFASTTLGLNPRQALVGTLCGSTLALLTTPLFGALADRIGRRPVLIFGFTFSAVFSFGFFWFVNLVPGTPWLFWVAMGAAVGIGNSSIFATGGTFFAELFDAKHRFSGFGISREGANALGSALSPLIALQIFHVSNGSTMWLSLFVTAVAAVALLGVVLARETYRSSIDQQTSPEPDSVLT